MREETHNEKNKERKTDKNRRELQGKRHDNGWVKEDKMDGN